MLELSQEESEPRNKFLIRRCFNEIRISHIFGRGIILWNINFVLLRRLDSAMIWPTAAIMAVQSQSYDFPQFSREFFEYYIIPMGWESGNREWGRNAGLFIGEERFLDVSRTRANESDSRSIIPRLVFMMTLRFEGDEGWKRTKVSLISDERGRVDSGGPRKSSWLLDQKPCCLVRLRPA